MTTCNCIGGNPCPCARTGAIATLVIATCRGGDPTWSLGSRDQLMSGEESGDVRKSETPQGGVGAQMPRDGSIPSAVHPDKKDAERYRWLRDGNDNPETHKLGIWQEASHFGDCYPNAGAVDAAIDAAMAAPQEPTLGGTSALVEEE